MQNNDDPPRRRRLRFVPGIEPGPAFIESELSSEEIAERYISGQHARAAEIRKEARRDGDGDQTARPALPDNESKETRLRRRPGAR